MFMPSLSLIALPSELFALSLALFAALVLGISKSGIKGIAILVVTCLALSYGTKASTGILMPLLICGDLFAIIYYRKTVKWRYLLRLLPPMIVGVLLGVFIGHQIPVTTFKLIMGSIILLSVLLLFYWEYRETTRVSQHWIFAPFFGILAGFTSMIGNLAGPITNIYFLAIRLPKYEFIATSAWLFFIINLFKAPFHIWVWETITYTTLMESLSLLPYTLLGLAGGVFLVKKIQEQRYRKLILFFTLLGSLAILF
ncbi:MAG: sulfite exporter TauE/SafE family protein [Flavobacteriia bacterium]|nr:sulfite exporter TauE/SafE family protein [Flavobacteriia bacterium]